MNLLGKLAAFASSITLSQGAYNDFVNHYSLHYDYLSWDAAAASCIRMGKRLAPITNATEQDGV